MDNKSTIKPFNIKPVSIILISCLGTLVYSNTFHSPFQFDDFVYIVHDYFIRNIQNLPDIWGIYPYRFVPFLSIALNYHFNQLDVFGYHFFNLATHLLSAILVWWLVLLTLATPVMKEDRITRHADLVALLAGLVFVSHPIQTEAVTYIWQRTASMATMFYLASLCFYVKYRTLNKTGSPLIYYVSSLGMAIAAMFTKEMAVTLPFMILLYENCFLKTEKSLNWKYVMPFFFTLFLICLTVKLLPMSIQAQEMQGVLRGANFISPTHYLLTQFRVMVTYMRLVFLPVEQSLDYDYPIYKNIFQLPVLSSILFLATVLYFAKCLFSKYRLLSFSIFWFFLTLLPESSVIPLEDVIVEHRLYLPMVGYSIFLVSGLYYLWGNKTMATMVMVFAMIIGGNSWLTYQRNKVWKDNFSLWDDTVHKSPHKARAYGNRGNVYREQGKWTQAMADFNKAIALNPNYPEEYASRGIIYDKQGALIRAMADFNKAIRLNPNYAEAYSNRGHVYYEQGNLAQAMSDYHKAIEIDPRIESAYTFRGFLYDKQGHLTQAMSDYHKAIEIDPNNGDIYNHLGRLDYKQKNFVQAISDFNKAIDIDPKNTDAFNNRGLIYDKQGEFALAMADFTRAVEIDPVFAEAYYNRGNIYVKKGDITRALADYNKALELNPRLKEAYNNRNIVLNKQAIATKTYLANAQDYSNRGVMYFMQGSLIRAISDYDKAIELNPKLAEAYYNRSFIYIKQEKYAQAISDLNKAIGLNPKLAVAYINRGLIYAKQNNFIQAISNFTKAIELTPGYKEGYSNRAFSYYELKEYNKSWADVRKAKDLGVIVDPWLISALKNVTGQDK